MNDIPDDPAALKRALLATLQRLREIERERALPPQRKELAAALGVNVATISRWRREGLSVDATPEQAARWRREKCHTMPHKIRRRKRRGVRK
ncbi:MAG: hypothetical protein JJU00_12775 [Opitutales bacterium]|nr:hypothetical protein [Opitutales bacterium]